jgi:hypothetical protein
MTIPQPAAPAAPPPVPVPPPPPKYTPPAGSRNESLLDMLETAKAQVKEAEKRVRAIKAAIENEATVMFAGARVIDIPAGPNRPPYRLRWVTPQKVSHDILKERYLGVYNDCLVWSTPYWQLEKVKG